MAKEKKELPKHIKEFYDKDVKVDQLISTTEAVHSEAYLKGLEAVKDSKTGQIDYDMLKEVKNQDAMLEKMMDHYLSHATKALGYKEKPKEELEQDLMLKRYYGVTRGELKRIMREAKHKYTLKQHEGIRDELIKKQRHELAPLRHSHLEEVHIDDILKHVRVKDYVAKDKINISHAATLLDIYKDKGEITLNDLEQLTETSLEKGGWGSKNYLTEKGKEAIKKLK
ncbi:hypothetical protein HZC32_03520, partial [Candidatus Woesearchaeota archaeon]|nr:hypothetical protein [Candidatus Woesearchaeota archaeon]